MPNLSALPPLIPIDSNKPDRPTACKIAQVSRPTIYKWARQGKIRLVQFGTQLTRVDTASLLAHLGFSTPAE